MAGIGFELARYATEKGYDLIIAADEPEIESAAERLKSSGADVHAVQADLSTKEGVSKLYDAIKACGRPVDALCANAGRGLGKGFLDQDPEAWRKVIDTNVTGTLDLVWRVGRYMRDRREGFSSPARSPASFRARSRRSITRARRSSTPSPSRFATK